MIYEFPRLHSSKKRACPDFSGGGPVYTGRGGGLLKILIEMALSSHSAKNLKTLSPPQNNNSPI